MKKLFFISGSFFLLVLAFLAVYNFAFRHNTADPVADPAKKEAFEEKKAAEASETTPRSVIFDQIIPEDVLQPVAGENGIFYYSSRDNAIKEASFDGKNQTTLIRNLPGPPNRLVWSPNRQGILALIKRDGGELWHHIDLRNRVVTPLKKEMSRLTWTSLGDRILYQFTDPENNERTINISLPDGSNWAKLATLGRDDHFIAMVPQSSTITFWKRTNGQSASALEAINITGENRRLLVSPRFGADFLWSPDSRRLLVQSVTREGSADLELGLADERGGGYRNLLAPTFVSKIAWSKDSETFYYALPGAFPAGTVLPNDYHSRAVTSADTFWKMNVRTGKKERLVPIEEMTQVFDASDIFLSPTETDLYFVDRLTSKLYRITL
jgi:hypothetical protein